ncbi:MAG: cupin domain-containing protein [Saprospiraceae bacterium]|nr:cupin domain-containing protein [Saprospiraceae bacterium]
MSQPNLEEKSDSAGNYVLFNSEHLLNVKEGMDRPYLPFFDNPNLSMGIYKLKVGAIDQQNPHEIDEIYYTMSGKCKFEVEGDSMDVMAGSILFVKADAIHRFYDIEEDVTLLVFFTKSKEQ